MRASKSRAVFVLVVGLVVSSVGVAAQDEEPADEPSTPAKVTGAILGVGGVVQEPTEAVVDGVRQLRGFVLEGERFEADDPRLTGSVSVAVNSDVHAVDDSLDIWLQSVFQRIENERGSWAGPCTVIEVGAPDHITCQMSGAGAYEGLTAYLVGQINDEPPYPFEGAIFAGGMPPVPVGPELSAETEGAPEATIISGEMTQGIRVWVPEGPGGSWPVVYVAPEYGGDLDQPVAMFGWSMGAALVLETGLRESVYGAGGDLQGCGDRAPRPDIVVPLSGCWYQFENQVFDDFEVNLPSLGNTDARLKLVVGTDDDVCHAWQSEQAAEALRGAGYDVDLVETEQGDHFTVVEEAHGMEVVQAILDAIDGAPGS